MALPFCAWNPDVWQRGQGRKGVAALHCPSAPVADTPRYPSAVQIPFSCLVLAPLVIRIAERFPASTPYHCNWRNLMLTGLSKIYRLNICLDFKGLAGLDYFPTLLVQSNLCTSTLPQPPEWLCCCRCWRAVHPPPIRALSLPPSPGVLLCTVLTNCSICCPFPALPGPSLASPQPYSST